jgi:hypothetical protein
MEHEQLELFDDDGSDITKESERLDWIEDLMQEEFGELEEDESE